MRLSSPSFGIYLISTILVVLIVLTRYFSVDIPILTPIVAGHPFEVTLFAWAILFAGVSFNL